MRVAKAASHLAPPGGIASIGGAVEKSNCKGTYLRLGALEENVALLSARSLAADAYLLQLLHASQRNYTGQKRINVVPMQDIQAQTQNQGSPSVHMQALGDGGTSVQQNFVAQDGMETPVLFTHNLPARDKGKGIVETGEEASPHLDMVSPYSPETDGGHIIDRALSNRRKVFGCSNLEPQQLMDPE
ncbi:hypothetical protein PIB30_066348 [Stylosanthes scabra]|uniref:Uncharacterized protein n=1 Tax=Stylosanthes scabra TaxID=79078 RepID=A0ABU6UQ63_9FABA|nr:hypothetical protein [Stylosanthes scabra]